MVTQKDKIFCQEKNKIIYCCRHYQSEVLKFENKIIKNVDGFFYIFCFCLFKESIICLLRFCKFFQDSCGFTHNTQNKHVCPIVSMLMDAGWRLMFIGDASTTLRLVLPCR